MKTNKFGDPYFIPAETSLSISKIMNFVKGASLEAFKTFFKKANIAKETPKTAQKGQKNPQVTQSSRGCIESKNMISAQRKSTKSSLNPSIIQVGSFKCRADVPLAEI